MAFKSDFSSESNRTRPQHTHTHTHKHAHQSKQSVLLKKGSYWMTKWSHLWELLHKKNGNCLDVFWEVCVLAFCSVSSNFVILNLSLHSPQLIHVIDTAFTAQDRAAHAVHPLLTELNALQEELKPFGVVVLGFPCNQFGKQEPAKNSEILMGLK